MRREFLILLCYVGPKFPSSLASCKLLSTAAMHTPGKTNVVCLAPGIQSACPQDAPDLTPNLFWFIQDPKDRHLPQSPAEWWHNLWCPFGFNGARLGAPYPEAAPRAGWEQPLGWNGHSSWGEGLSFNDLAWWPFWWHRRTGKKPLWISSGQNYHSKGGNAWILVISLIQVTWLLMRITLKKL